MAKQLLLHFTEIISYRLVSRQELGGFCLDSFYSRPQVPVVSFCNLSCTYITGIVLIRADIHDFKGKVLPCS